MATPLLEALAASAASHVGGSLVGAGETPLMRGSVHSLNMVARNQPPSPSDILAAYRAGLIKSGFATAALSIQGVEWGPAAGTDPFGKAWDAVYRSGFARPGIEDVLRLYRLAPDQLPAVQDLLRYQGADAVKDWPLWQRLAAAPIDLSAAQEAVRRGQWTRDQWDVNARDLGIMDPAAREAVWAARIRVPSPGELIAWVGRRADDDQLAALLGLDNGLERLGTDPYASWLKWGGASDDQVVAAWRAHWDVGGSQDLLLALSRTRPDRLARWQAVFPGLKSLDPDTFLKLYEVSGIPRQLAAWQSIGRYSIPTIRQHRMLIKTGVWTGKDLENNLLDHLYLPEDAKDIADATVREVLREDLPRIVQESMGQIRTGLKLGALSEMQARNLLSQHGVVGTDADAFFGNSEVDRTIDLVRQSISAIRTMRLRGALDGPGCERELAAAGVDARVAVDLCRVWSLQLMAGRRQLAASQILDYTRRGVLSVLAAEVRLSNLGYAGEDIAAMLLRVEQEVESDAYKAAQAALRRIEQLKAKAEKAAAAAERKHRQGVSDLKAHGAPAQLRTWYHDGSISYAEALQRLVEMDWPPLDADRLLRSEPPPKPSAGGPGPGGKPPKPSPATGRRVQLSVPQILKLLRDGLIGESDALGRLLARGWNREDATLLIRDTLLGAGKGAGTGAASGGLPSVPPAPNPPPAK